MDHLRGTRIVDNILRLKWISHRTIAWKDQMVKAKRDDKPIHTSERNPPKCRYSQNKATAIQTYVLKYQETKRYHMPKLHRAVVFNRGSRCYNPWKQRVSNRHQPSTIGRRSIGKHSRTDQQCNQNQSRVKEEIRIPTDPMIWKRRTRNRSYIKTRCRRILWRDTGCTHRK